MRFDIHSASIVILVSRMVLKRVSYKMSSENFFKLKGLFHPACLARVVSWCAFVMKMATSKANQEMTGAANAG